MNASQERRLYDTDRQAWARYAAPRLAAIGKRADDQEKRRMWSMAGPELRAELRRLADSHGLARNTDPDTSHQAAERMQASGARDDHVRRIAQAVRENPAGRTSAELAKIAGLERHEAARRASDAEHAGLVHKALKRTCSISGRAAVTWRPGPAREGILT